MNMAYETKSSDIFSKSSDAGKQKVFDFMQQLMTCPKDADKIFEEAKRAALDKKSKNSSI